MAEAVHSVDTKSRLVIFPRFSPLLKVRRGELLGDATCAVMGGGGYHWVLMVMLSSCLFVAGAGGLLEGGMVRLSSTVLAREVPYTSSYVHPFHEVIRLGAMAAIEPQEDTYVQNWDFRRKRLSSPRNDLSHPDGAIENQSCPRHPEIRIPRARRCPLTDGIKIPPELKFQWDLLHAPKQNPGTGSDTATARQSLSTKAGTMFSTSCMSQTLLRQLEEEATI